MERRNRRILLQHQHQRKTINKERYAEHHFVYLQSIGFHFTIHSKSKDNSAAIMSRKTSGDEEIPKEEYISWKRWLAELPILAGFNVESARSQGISAK